MEIYPGTIHLSAYLTIEEQKSLMRRCVAIGSQPAGFYTPAVRGGAYMSIKMVCLGRHWNAKTYKYEAIRSDHDGLPVQELPDDLKELARSAAAEASERFKIASYTASVRGSFSRSSTRSGSGSGIPSSASTSRLHSANPWPWPVRPPRL